MISDDQFIAWLSQEHAARVVLYEQDYTYEDAGAPAAGTLYLSDRPYAPTDAVLPYVDCIATVPEFTRSLGGNRLSSYSSSIGSVEIVNTDGELDFMLDLAIDGSAARFYYGDASWPRSDFRLIFSVFGIRVQRAPFRRLTVELKDSTALLNQSIGGTTLVGGSGPDANHERPLNFGFIHNLTPLSLDSINLTYVHSDTGDGTVALDVRDDGVPVIFNDNADGTLELDASPAGLITCDVDALPSEDSGGDNRNVSDAIAHLIGERAGFIAAGLYAGPHPTFVEDDVDDYPIGISIYEAQNLLEILGALTDSGNCFAAIRRDGQFTFGRLKPYDVASFALDPVNIVEDDIVPASGFSVEHLTPEYYRFQAYAHKNWTVQSTLSDVLNPDEKARFSRKGQYALQSLVGGTTYELAPELYHKTLSTSPPVETLLSWADDSSILYLTTWMEQRRAMFLPWIEIADVSLPLGANPEDPAMFYALELGDVVNVILPRFGYDTGTLFQVISVGINLSKARTTLRIVRKRGASAPPVGWEASQQYIIQSVLDYGWAPPAIDPVVTVPPIVPGGSDGDGGVLGPLVSFFEAGAGGGGDPEPEEDTNWYFLDRFSETFTDLSTHNPDIGSAYAADADFPDRVKFLLDSDYTTQLYANVTTKTGPAYGIAPISPVTPNYFIEAKVSWDGSIEGAIEDDICLLARKVGDTCYQLRVGIAQGNTGSEYATLTIVRLVDGSPGATVGTHNDVPFASGLAPHVIRWTLEGAVLVTHKVFVNGTKYIEDDDSGIPAAGEEVGFGVEQDTSEGTYFDTIYWDWVACGGLQAGPEFQIYSETLSLGPDTGGVRYIEYPWEGEFFLDLHLINQDPEATYTIGWGTDGDFSSVSVNVPAPGVPFLTGSFDGALEYPATMTITISKNGVPLSPIIEIIPEP